MTSIISYDRRYIEPVINRLVMALEIKDLVPNTHPSDAKEAYYLNITHSMISTFLVDYMTRVIPYDAHDQVMQRYVDAAINSDLYRPRPYHALPNPGLNHNPELEVLYSQKTQSELDQFDQIKQGIGRFIYDAFEFCRQYFHSSLTVVSNEFSSMGMEIDSIEFLFINGHHVLAVNGAPL